MKVLNMTERDFGGAGYRLTEALMRGEHQAKHITRLPSILGYEQGFVTGDEEVVKRWVEWADVVNCWSTMKSFQDSWLKPSSRLFFIAVGSWYWLDHEKIHRNANASGFVVLSGSAALLEWGAKWLPIAIPVERWRKLKKRRAGKRPVVCQSPLVPDGNKNTPAIKAVLFGKTDIDFKVITGVSHNQCMHEKAIADIYLGQFRARGGPDGSESGGYGMSSLEAWAMRIPVITVSPDWIEESYINEIGYLPYYRSEMEDLPEAIDALLSDHALYNEYANRGYEYVLKFHDYPSVVKRFEELCRG